MRELFGGPEWASEERVSDNPALVWFSLPASLLSEAGSSWGKTIHGPSSMMSRENVPSPPSLA
jgi:hypothetical protein